MTHLEMPLYHCPLCNYSFQCDDILSEARDGEIAALVPKLLVSNTGPWGVERDALSNILFHAERYCTALDAEIASMQAGLDALLAEKAKADKSVAEIKTILHPVRILPADILSHIFALANSAIASLTPKDVRGGEFPDSLDTKGPLWVVSSVSQEWRRVSLSTPELWSSLHLQFDRYPKSPRTNIFLGRYLKRSAELPLSVLIYATEDHPYISGALIPHHRWKTAGLELPFPVHSSWNDLNLDLPLLCALHLNVWPLLGIHGFLNAFAKCPQLSVVSSDTIGVAQMMLPWASIRDIRQTGVLDDDRVRAFETLNGAFFRLYLFLVLCPALRSLSGIPLRTIPNRFITERLRLQSHIRHIGLRSLTLKGSPEGRQQLLSIVEMPFLASLTFDDESMPPMDGTLSFFPEPLIAPTGETLTFLSVPIQSIDTAALVAFLASTPKLGHLRLELKALFNIGPTARAILNKQPLIPELKRWDIVGSEGVDVDMEFSRALKARRVGAEGIALLEEVTVNYVLELAADVEAAFLELVENGLRGGLKRMK